MLSGTVRLTTIKASENIPYGYSEGLDLSYLFRGLFQDNGGRRMDWWQRAMSTYSELYLTESKDKLIAISAIAKRLQSIDVSEKYIAGLVSTLFVTFEPNISISYLVAIELPQWHAVLLLYLQV